VSSHTLLDCCMGFICVLWLVEHLVSMSKVRAPRRNKLRAPSPLCERTGQYEVSMRDTVFAARQAD
jgi:hypothetical protein